MKLQTGATQVATRTAQLMRATRAGHRYENAPGAIKEPTWFRVVLSHPPTHDILPKVRQLKKYQKDDRKTNGSKEDKFFATRNKKQFSSNPKHLYKLDKLVFEEDEIRNLFYTNHPWELARPRSMVEQDDETKINKQRDWSSLDQEGLALSGESVVQRTLWLAAQPSYKSEDWYDAYTQARLEFYRLRIREQAEADVAAEEALMFGAILDQTAIGYGVAREQEVIDQYVVDALEASKALQSEQQQNSAQKEEVSQPQFD